MTRLLFASSALVVVLTTTNASAQGFFVSPFVGTTLSSPTPTGSQSKAGFGVAFGSLGKIVGFDTEIAYFPELLDNNVTDLAKSKVVTFSGDVLIGPMIGPVKVYGAIGAGDLFLNIQSLSSLVVPNPASVSSNYFTFNAGGGVVGFFNPHFGVRGDLRYFRAYGFDLPTIESGQLALTNFNFWRAGIGLAVAF
jgi:hypothetical protein